MKDRPEDIGEVRDGREYVRRHANEVIEIEEDLRIWTLAEMYRSPAFWSIGVIFGSMTCVFTAVMMHLFSHLQDIGIDTSTAAGIMSATAAFAALGKPVTGWLADYLGAKVTIWLELFCQGSALLIFGTTESTGTFDSRRVSLRFWLCRHVAFAHLLHIHSAGQSKLRDGHWRPAFC
jgi:nitrate/nitrite transporter NarK